MLFDQLPPARSSNGGAPNFLPPPELNVPLWRSLYANLRYCVVAEHLPPLQLTSRPMRVGMLVGDILDVPWYRTILSNLGDAISPETMPPLQFESEPVEVELISDQPAWWRSLLRNLADAAAPERLPALHLTSAAVNPEMASQVLIAPRWSSLIATPLLEANKAFLREPRRASLARPQPRTATIATPLRTTLLQLPPLDPPEEPEFEDFERKLLVQLRRSVHSSHIREFVWLSVIAAEVIAVVMLRLMPH